MKITYIAHSGFSVELENQVLLFDYYTGELPQWDPEKLILIFVSHKHQDHFSHRIFELYAQYPNVHFFFGNDIRLNEKWYIGKGFDPAVREAVTRMKGGEAVWFRDVRVQALRSTDVGVAFVVETEGKRFYHAGDLNWWHWEGEDPAWNRQMETEYKQETEKLRGKFFDAAFVPLDPRLGDAYDWGMNFFLSVAQARHVFPMHMWEEYAWIAKYKESETGRQYRDVICDIHDRGEIFESWN